MIKRVPQRTGQYSFICPKESFPNAYFLISGLQISEDKEMQFDMTLTVLQGQLQNQNMCLQEKPELVK